MIGILVVTHGQLSEQLLATAAMIMGPAEAAKAITFSAKESLDDLKKKAAAAADEFQEDGCLILTDIMGGSATNVSIELMKSRTNVEVVTGVSLPMLVEALSGREDTPLKELAARVAASGAKSIINLKEFFEKRAAKRV